MRPLTPERVAWICAGLGAVLFAAAVISLRIGAYPISVVDIVKTLFSGMLGRWEAIPSEYRSIVFDVRLPRILLGILVGASLSTAGSGFQALLRNPLADPYVLGVSSGAALGAILALIAAPHVPGAVQLAAFAGAAATTAAVYFLGRRGGQVESATLLLAGIVAVSFLSAVIMFLMTTLSGRDMRGMAFWLMTLSLLEIAIWGSFYLSQGCLPDAESAFYFSGTTYTSIGYGDVVLAKHWRMLGPVEGLTGLLMCGLSAGLFFAVVSRIYASRLEAGRK